MIRLIVIALGLLANAAAAQGLSAARMTETCGGLQVTFGFDDTGADDRIAVAETTVRARASDTLSALLDYVHRDGDQIIVSVPAVQVADFDAQAMTLPFGFGIHDVAAIGEAGSLEAGPRARVVLSQFEPDMEYAIGADPFVDGSGISDAQAMQDQNGRPSVHFRFSPTAASVFSRYTGDNIGAPIAIVVNDMVTSAPVIRDQISGGTGLLTGDFTNADAVQLAAMMRAGPMPAGLRVIHQTSIDGSDPSSDFCP